MKDHDHAVQGSMEIDFHAGCPEFKGGADRRERVLRGVFPGSAMQEDNRAARASATLACRAVRCSAVSGFKTACGSGTVTSGVSGVAAARHRPRSVRQKRTCCTYLLTSLPVQGIIDGLMQMGPNNRPLHSIEKRRSTFGMVLGAAFLGRGRPWLD